MTLSSSAICYWFASAQL